MPDKEFPNQVKRILKRIPGTQWLNGIRHGIMRVHELFDIIKENRIIVFPSYSRTGNDEFNLYQNIRFFDFTIQPTRRQIFKRRYNRLLNRLAILFRLPRNEGPNDIIDQRILNKTKEIIGKSQYYCFVGIEKKGLVWAGILSEMYHCPLIYHSLELYTRDHPGVDRFYHLLDAESKYHKQAAATIIQDDLRADILLKHNGAEQTNVF